MAYFNRVVLLGNLTRDPELRTLPSDTKVADFGLATSRRYKTTSGEEREEVLFIDCAAFGRSAELIEQFCRKGRQLLVEGRLKYDTWEDRTTGQKRNKLSLVVESFQFLGTGGERTEAPPQAAVERRMKQDLAGGSTLRKAPGRHRAEDEHVDLLAATREEEIPF